MPPRKKEQSAKSFYLRSNKMVKQTKGKEEEREH